MKYNLRLRKSYFLALASMLLISCFYLSAQGQLNNVLDKKNMILVEGGSFNMGSMQGLKNEQPVHAVTVKSFYICKYELTNDLYDVVMNHGAVADSCADCPVTGMQPQKTDSFLNKLNHLTGKHYRLPTEAEWEYAALGGNKSKGYKYPGSDSLDEVAWYKSTANQSTHRVGEKKPNELGLYDMSGNVWEMCSDWFDNNYYKRSPASNPINSKKAVHIVVRGGSWRSPKERCYSKARNRNIKDHRKNNDGVRLVLDL